MAAQFTLYPLNDLVLEVEIKTPSATKAGTSTPVTTGTATAFLALSDAPDAVEADASLVTTGSHIAKGWWRFTFDATDLDATLLDTLFSAATPYAIVEHDAGIRVFAEGTYSASREAA